MTEKCLMSNNEWGFKRISPKISASVNKKNRDWANNCKFWNIRSKAWHINVPKRNMKLKSRDKELKSWSSKLSKARKKKKVWWKSLGSSQFRKENQAKQRKKGKLSNKFKRKLKKQKRFFKVLKDTKRDS